MILYTKKPNGKITHNGQVYEFHNHELYVGEEANELLQAFPDLIDSLPWVMVEQDGGYIYTQQIRDIPIIPIAPKKGKGGH